MTKKNLKNATILGAILSAFIFVGFDQSKADAPLATKGETAEGTVMLSNTTVIDGTGNAPVSGVSVLIQNGIITAIGKDVTKPADAIEFDLTGRYVIPGLIEGHGHLTEGEEIEEGKNYLNKVFASGITSVRDMAGNGTALKKLQDWGADASNPAARTYFSALVAGPEFFANDERVPGTAGNSTAGEVAWMPVLEEATDVKALVSEAKEFGVTALKLYADISPELAARVTTEARAQGLKVWSHALLKSAIVTDLLEPGVDGISHAIDLSSVGQPRRIYRASEAHDHPHPLPVDAPEVTEFLAKLKAKGIVLDATLAVTADVAGPEMVTFAAEVTRRANEMGVLIGAGTDLAGSLLHEMTLLVDTAGLTPLQALQAATINNARVMGIDAEYGTVEIGKIGDLVVLEADPLADINNLLRVIYVAKEGRIYHCNSSATCTME